MKMKITPVDKHKELDGVETDYYGVTLRIARANNSNFVKAFKSESNALKRAKGNAKIDADAIEAVATKAMAKTILVGWSGFEMDGKEIEYSSENAFNLLTNDHDVREFVSSFANDMDNFMEEVKGDLMGESEGQ